MTQFYLILPAERLCCQCQMSSSKEQGITIPNHFFKIHSHHFQIFSFAKKKKSDFEDHMSPKKGKKGVLVSFRLLWWNTMTISKLWGKGFICLTGYSPSVGGSQHRNLEAGSEADTMEECCLWACVTWLAQSAFFYNSGPWNVAWALPSHINH